MEDHTELLIELMQKTIEQKDEQIRELRETIENLQTTVASLNKPLKNSAGNSLALPVKDPAGKCGAGERRRNGKSNRQKLSA